MTAYEGNQRIRLLVAAVCRSTSLSRKPSRSARCWVKMKRSTSILEEILEAQDKVKRGRQQAVPPPRFPKAMTAAC